MRGEYEMTAISIHAYPHVADKYQLTACGSSMGDDYGPMIVTREPMRVDDLAGRTIAVPGLMTTAYLTLWIGIAAISVAVVALELGRRCYLATSPLSRQFTWLAVQQFLPSIAAGGLLTCTMIGFAPECLWMLPGLWATLFSLGIFASCRLLPKATFWAGVYYLLAGAAALAIARGEAAFSPWAMAGTFGVGQLLVAAILYLTLERPHART